MHLSIDARSKLRVIRGGANDEIILYLRWAPLFFIFASFTRCAPAL